MRAVTCLLTVVSLVPSATLSAQVPPPLEPGQRVRVTARDSIGQPRGRLVGMVVTVTAENIVVEQRGDQLTIPREVVTRLEVSRGRKSNVGKGAAFGFLGGAGLGALLGAVVGASAQRGDFCQRDSGCAGEYALIGGAAFGVLGAGIGAIVGAASKTDRWEEVPLDRLSVGFAPQRDGRFALGLSVRF